MQFSTTVIESAFKKCHHCGDIHDGQCPRVKAIEYYECGSIKRIEYHDAPETPMPSGPCLYCAPIGTVSVQQRL